MICSLLDNDLYKLTQMQAVLHQFPGANVEYRFVCRSPDIDFSKAFPLIKDSIRRLCDLTFFPDELDYLSSLRVFKPDFIDFLRTFRLQERYLHLSADSSGPLNLTIAGPWLQTILFEVPLLAIISESYCHSRIIDTTAYDKNITCGMGKLSTKLSDLKARFLPSEFKFVDFGTRRRFGFNWHKFVVDQCRHSYNFYGTSNLYFAKEYNLRSMGTMAHEWPQAGQSLTHVADSQKLMLQKWADEYRGNLGIALSDTVGVDAFIRDFDLYFAKLFNGCRQDSGDPVQWAAKILLMYNRLGIDPKTKTIVFSDGLSLPEAVKIYKTVHSDFGRVLFGIGTNLTNDFDLPALNMVIKMVSCNGRPVAKISDSPGKTICDDEKYLAYLKSQFKIA
jgi:nicotinate phosphoribosyltransferase